MQYRDTLDQISRGRYDEKLQLINEKDPYEDILSKDWSKSPWPDVFPDSTYPDIVNYLVNGISAYSFEDLKAYRSLESYNQFVCGLVTDVSHTVINSRHLMMAKVSNKKYMCAGSILFWTNSE